MQDERTPHEPPSDEREIPSRNVALVLSAVIVLALFLRAVPLLARNYVGDADQCVYLSIAQGLLHGHYPTGDFGPGFPMAVAGLLLVGSPLVWAGRLASLVLGLLLVVVAFALARRLYGPATGLALAFIVAVHSALVDNAMGGMSEGALLLGLLLGLLLLVRGSVAGSERAATLRGIGAGLCFGYAYLTRPDGMLYGVVTCLVWAWYSLRLPDTRRRELLCAGGAALALAAVVFTNTLLIHGETGQWRPQQRRLDVASVYDEAQSDVQEKLLFSAAPGHGADGGTDVGSGGHEGRSLSSRLKRLVHDTYGAYATALPEGLDPLLLALAGLGLFGRMIAGAERRRDVLLLSLWLILPALAVAYQPRVRHLLPLILIGLIWAAEGARVLAERATAADPRRGNALRWGVICALVLCAQLKPNMDLTQAAFTGEVPTEERVAGHWLKDHAPADGLVLERKSVVAFYAGMHGLVPPPSSLGDVLAFAAEKNARYLIVSERRLPYRPFLRPLLDATWAGNPSLRRAYETPVTKRQPQKLVIYEFVRTG